jgi:hypothetical protein
MRVLIGIILGGVLTIGAAYLYDSHNALAANTQANAPRPVVNWDVVNVKWDHLTQRARAEWTRLAANL